MMALGGSDHEFFVRFWGVRRDIPCCESDVLRYGGNTSCLEVRCGNQLLVFDAGTGFRHLGNSIAVHSDIDADIFFSQTSFDLVCGLPFFKPAFSPTNRFKIFSGHLLPDFHIQGVLQHLMREPLFPVPLQIFQSEFSYHDFCAGETLKPRDGVVVHTALLQDAYKTTGFRIEYNNRSICYLTKTEHIVDRLETSVYRLIEDADIVICDAMFTGESGSDRLIWSDGIHLCSRVGAKKLVIFPHLPEHGDAFLDVAARQASAFRPITMIASEGMVVHP